MKKNILLPIITLVFVCSLFFTASVRAHEIIPQELKEYLATHPTATPQEIQNFFAALPNGTTGSAATQNLTGAAVNSKHGFIATIKSFIPLGIMHVLSGPDHVLFIISLLLVFTSFREILKMTGAFTIAHSTTLIASTAFGAALSSHIVEPLIAFSIAYVAITSVFLKKYDFFSSQRSKLATVFFFGLFHGLGFAGAITELHIPANNLISTLLTFNIGIELGQLIVIAAVLPILYLLRNKSWYATFIKITALGIAGIALFWAVERIIG